MKVKKKILFLGPYPKEFGPSQRFRLEVYLPYLSQGSFDYTYETFYSLKSYQELYKKGKFISKMLSVFKGFMRRFSIPFRVHKFDYVFIQREITPIGPPVIEWFISKFCKANVIYDFDDAIWLPNFSKENAFFNQLKNYGKVKHIIKWSDTVVAGNSFLRDYAIKFNPNTIVIPTVVDTDNVHNAQRHKKSPSEKLTIGWTGTLTTNLHIEHLLPVFEKLNKKYDYNLLLISNEKPKVSLDNVQFLEWNKDNEIDQLIQIDIGLMPLKTNEDFYKGKCGFKAIQYMALGIPAVVTPIGINTEIIEDNVNGYIAESMDDWYNIIERLIMAKKVDNEILIEARKKIIENFSVKSHLKGFMKLFS